jgi:hypothetical protein
MMENVYLFPAAAARARSQVSSLGIYQPVWHNFFPEI